MKKIVASFLIIFIIILTLGVNINASPDLEELKRPDGSTITYRGSDEPIMIPTEYTQKEQEFRGVWVSQFAGDIGIYTSDDSFKNILLNVLDTMEDNNLNTIIYHLRIMNDALYDSDLNPISNYVRGANFEEWDYLEWFIDEVHERGMEFHAWLNPYRIQNSVDTPEKVAARYKAYPQNPASNPKNILVGDSGVILNPGEPAVRDFVVDASMEVVEKYDVDAIHFDDYFYISGSQDAHTRAKYNTENMSVEDWRRKQVDLFIEDLSNEIGKYNRANNRQVQLGISPSGIWRNDDGDGSVNGYNDNGDAITNGSNTRGFAHYGNYLFSDTKKWIDREWIDYIIPQVYWGFTQPIAPHGDIVDWWAKVVKYKDVNLYIGMGLYMIHGGDIYWNENPMEAANQVLYHSKHEDVDGVAVYSFKHLKLNKDQAGFSKVINEFWTNPVITPTLDRMGEVTPEPVGDVNVVKTSGGFVLDFEPTNNAKRYAIYRSTGDVDIEDSKQLIKIIGEEKDHNLVIFNDIVDNTSDYNYAIVSISGTNTKGQAKYINTNNPNENINFDFAKIEDIHFSNVVYPNLTYNLFFQEGTVYAGSGLTYEVYTSSNKEDWILVEENLRKSGRQYSIRLLYPTSLKPIYYKLVAYNELGKLEGSIVTLNPTINNINKYFEFVDELIKDKFSKIIGGF